MANSNRNTLTQERLKELLSYDPETGLFIRLSSQGRCSAGAVSSGSLSNGAMLIGVDNRVCKVHRIAWLYMTGESPAKGIDHIDGDFKNNKFSNLRLANQSENLQNRRRAGSNSKSGLLGVSWHRKIKKWVARITVGNKYLHLGSYKDSRDAYAAYLAAKAKYHPFQMIAPQEDL